MSPFLLDPPVDKPPTQAANVAMRARLAFLEHKSQEMDESIRYAGQLQKSILPSERLFKENFEDAFILFQPKDVVSGDFYWFYRHESDIYFAVGDCTGHGVPGALVNIAGNTILRQIIRLDSVSDPAQIIQLLDDEIVSLFNEHLTTGETRDGMDIVFCKFNVKSGVGQFCGAGRPLVLVRDGELIEFKKGPSCVGYSPADKQFETVTFDLKKGDQFYLFSDGYTGQFGGQAAKTFNKKRFRSLIQSVENLDMESQKRELEESYFSWKGPEDQVDDICVIGVRI